MRFKFCKTTYYSVPLLLFLCLLSSAYFFLIQPVKGYYSPYNFLVTTLLATVLILPIIPLACQSVEIDCVGVRKIFLFFKWREMSWDEIQEIGYKYNGNLNVTYKYVYFSKYSLTYEETRKGVNITRSKDAILVQHSEKLMSWLKKYTTDIEKKCNFY